MRLRPSASEARFAHAMGLVRLGRYRQARDSLSAAMTLHPERPQFAHALARVLAASPDPGVRNGEQALAIARELSARDRTTDLGETLAMALAETGKYEEAAAVQRGVIGAARRGGASALADAMTRTLREYEAGRPCRTPWRNDHPVHVPVPPAGVGDRQSAGVPRKTGPVS